MRFLGRHGFFQKFFALALLGLLFAAAFSGSVPARSGTSDDPPRSIRFASLKASKVNVRIGPSFKHEIAWTYRRQGLPVKILQSFDIWRRIQDADGDEGWVHKQLLSNRRTALVAPWQKGLPLATRKTPDDDAPITAFVEPGVIADVTACTGSWCHLAGDGFSGWIEQNQIWGVAPGEKFE